LHGPCPIPTHADVVPTTREPAGAKAKSQKPKARIPRHVELQHMARPRNRLLDGRGPRGCLVVRLPCRARHLRNAVRTVWGYSVRVLHSGIVKLAFNWLAATSHYS
jgi:hypothetical protein